MTVRCGACRKSENALTLTGDGTLSFTLGPPWRARNSRYSVLGMGAAVPGGSMVMLCSDVCQERYERIVGLEPLP